MACPAAACWCNRRSNGHQLQWSSDPSLGRTTNAATDGFLGKLFLCKTWQHIIYIYNIYIDFVCICICVSMSKEYSRIIKLFCFDTVFDIFYWYSNLIHQKSKVLIWCFLITCQASEEHPRPSIPFEWKPPHPLPCRCHMMLHDATAGPTHMSVPCKSNMIQNQRQEVKLSETEWTWAWHMYPVYNKNVNHYGHHDTGWPQAQPKRPQFGCPAAGPWSARQNSARQGPRTTKPATGGMTKFNIFIL